MGCFDYACECGGNECEHTGGQLHDANVVIEVPLSDGTTVYLKGHYEQYGYVTVEGYQFYPEQFREFFQGWLEVEKPEDRKKIFLSKRIWTLSETVYEYDYNSRASKRFANRNCFRKDIDVNISEFDPKNLSKYIRADEGIDFDAIRKKKIENLKSQIKALKLELKRLENI
jgi:hypothetical protein